MNHPLKIAALALAMGTAEVGEAASRRAAADTLPPDQPQLRAGEHSRVVRPVGPAATGVDWTGRQIRQRNRHPMPVLVVAHRHPAAARSRVGGSGSSS